MKRAVEFGDDDVLAGVHLAVEDARDRQASEIVAVVEIRDQNLQGPGRIAFRHGDRLQDGVEQRAQIRAAALDVGGSGAGLGVRVEHGEIELLFLGVEVDEQVVDFVEHFLRARVGAVDLVDDDDRRQVRFERLAEHVARLRQRTFAGIDEQHDAVDHLERALDFAAEVAVAGRVDDVDFYVVIEDGGVLGQDGDAALALQFVRVHHALDVVLVGRETCRSAGAWRRPAWSCRGRRAR